MTCDKMAQERVGITDVYKIIGDAVNEESVQKDCSNIYSLI